MSLRWLDLALSALGCDVMILRGDPNILFMATKNSAISHLLTLNLSTVSESI